MKHQSPGFRAFLVVLGLVAVGVCVWIVTAPPPDPEPTPDVVPVATPDPPEPPEPQPSPEPAGPPDPEPVDPQVLAEARERFGEVDEWRPGEEPCDHELPGMDDRLVHQPGDGPRVDAPQASIPLRIAPDEEHVLATFAEPVSRPTLLIWRSDYQAPTSGGTERLAEGRANGRAFLLVPGGEPVRCVGDYEAALAQRRGAPNELAQPFLLVAQLVVQERRAAFASLRAPAPRD